MASYIQQTLMAGERVLYRTRLRWIVYLKPVLLALSGVILMGLGTVYVQATGALLLFFSFWLLLIALLYASGTLLQQRTSAFGVTTKRVVVKVGCIRRRTVELMPRQIAAITVTQSVVGRLLNYGTVTLTGSGGVCEVFHQVAAPLELRRQIQQATERAPTAPAA